VAVNAINGTLATALNAPILSNWGRNSRPLVLYTNHKLVRIPIYRTIVTIP
jgi:hypothetical protein